MMRISVVESSSRAVTLRLEGEVKGGWVGELRQSCESVLSRGIVLALDCEHAVGQAYNVSNDEPLTQQEFLAAIAEELGVSAPSLHVPYHALYYAGALAERMSYLAKSKKQPFVTRLGVKLFGTDNRHSIEKARTELGYSPQVPIREGVRLAAEWYQAQAGGCRPGGKGSSSDAFTAKLIA